MSIGLAALQALGLGVLTTLQPCPLATNVAALSLISVRAQKVERPLWVGFAFLFGVSSTYVVLSVAITFGLLSTPAIANELQYYINRLLGPTFILIGMMFTGLLPSSGHLFKLAKVGAWMRERPWTVWSAFSLGAALALSFCPSTAALFFATLLPLALQNGSPFLLPIMYGLGASVPILGVTLFAAKGAALASRRWTERVPVFAGSLLMLIGFYYVLFFIFKVDWLQAS